MPSVTIDVRNAGWKTALRPYRKAVTAAIESALGKKRGEISVVLADDAFIRDLNKTYRGKDKATNVLSFPGDEHLGDIVLSLSTLKREAKEQGKTLKDHATHMLVHGALHLLGHNHEKTRDAEAMEGKEIKILKKLGVANPYLWQERPNAKKKPAKK